MKLVIQRKDGQTEEMYLKPSENPVEQLSKYIFKEENREEGLPYKAVEIFLPLPLLQVSLCGGMPYVCVAVPAYVYRKYYMNTIHTGRIGNQYCSSRIAIIAPCI